LDYEITVSTGAQAKKFDQFILPFSTASVIHDRVELEAIPAVSAIARIATNSAAQRNAAGQCNTTRSLSAGVSKPKVFRGR
jgi:hypothetical protein